VIAFGPDALTDLARQIWETDSTMPADRRDRYRQSFESNAETMMAQSMRMFMFVASGRADRLTGRHLHRRDDPEELERRAEEIVANDEYIITRIPPMPSGRPNGS
jgi:hypothetical protein